MTGQFWWAMQGENFRDVVPHGAMWTTDGPKGELPPTRKHIKDLLPGDIVFNFGDGHLQAVSQVTSSFQDNFPRPPDYPRRGNDDPDIGYLVRTTALRMNLEIRRSEFVPSIINRRDGPFDTSGNGKRQGYIWSLTFDEGQSLLALTDVVTPETPGSDSVGGISSIEDTAGTSSAYVRLVLAEQKGVTESHHRESASTLATRAERQLEDHLRASLGFQNRLAIKPDGQDELLHTDVWDEERRELFEVKSSTTRQHVQMAVGQLLDYRWYVHGAVPTCIVVVPTDPGADLRQYVTGLGMDLMFRDGNDRWERARTTDPRT